MAVYNLITDALTYVAESASGSELISISFPLTAPASGATTPYYVKVYNSTASKVQLNLGTDGISPPTDIAAAGEPQPGVLLGDGQVDIIQLSPNPENNTTCYVKMWAKDTAEVYFTQVLPAPI